MKPQNGLLFVLSAVSPNNADAYHAWYDEEHAPARLGVDGIETARRYQDISGENNYLAYYDLKSASVLDSPAYRALAPAASAREREVLAAIPPLDRRVYQAVRTPAASVADDVSICGDVLLAVWWTPAPGKEADFNSWYDEEHIPLLMRVPGWLRIRRYSLLEGNGPGYLALHDLASESSLETPEYQAATTTPWRDRVVADRVEYERRLFRLLRRFD